MKKIILSILIGQGLVMANSCKYYEKKINYYTEKANVLVQQRNTDPCAIADIAEQMLNNLYGAKGACLNGQMPELAQSIQAYTGILARSVSKCGH